MNVNDILKAGRLDNLINDKSFSDEDYDLNEVLKQVELEDIHSLKSVLKDYYSLLQCQLESHFKVMNYNDLCYLFKLPWETMKQYLYDQFGVQIVSVFEKMKCVDELCCLFFHERADDLNLSF